MASALCVVAESQFKLSKAPVQSGPGLGAGLQLAEEGTDEWKGTGFREQHLLWEILLYF